MSLGKGLNSLIAPGSGEDHGAPLPMPVHREEIRASHPREVLNTPTHSFEKKHTANAAPKQESIFHIEVEKIVPNPYQPRKVFNAEEIQELADSIKEFGVLQPISVSKVVKETSSGTRVEYQLVAGERRLKAAKLAGLPRVPAIIRKGDTPKMKLELALIENIQRSNLNPLESARGYARLQDEFNLTQKDIAARVGKSRETVANTMRLLNLPTYFYFFTKTPICFEVIQGFLCKTIMFRHPSKHSMKTIPRKWKTENILRVFILWISYLIMFNISDTFEHIKIKQLPMKH